MSFDIASAVPVDTGSINTGKFDMASAVPVDAATQAPKDPNFFQRVGQDYNKRVGMAQEAADAGTMGQQTTPETIGQMALNGGAGLVNDVVGEGVKTWLNPVKDNISNLVKTVGDTSVGKDIHSFLTDASNKYADFQKQNPRAGRDVDALGNALGIATLLTPVKGKSAAGLAKDTLDAGAGVGGAGVKAAVDSAGNIIPAVKNTAIAQGITARAPDALDHAAQAMKDVSSALYKKSEDAGAILTPQASNMVVNKLRRIVPEPNTAASKSLYGNTLSAIDSLKEDVQAGNVSLQTLDRHRQVLGNLAKDIMNQNRAQEAEAAGRAIDAIDETVGNFGPDHIVNKNIEAVNALDQARAQWSKAKKFETVSGIIQQANGDPNRITAAFQRFVSKKKNLVGFSPDEIAALKDAGTNSMSQKVMKGLGRFGISPENMFMPSVGGAGITALAGAPAAGGILAAGTVARQAGKWAARGKAENALQAIENRVIPDAVERPPPAPPAAPLMLTNQRPSTVISRQADDLAKAERARGPTVYGDAPEAQKMLPSPNMPSGEIAITPEGQGRPLSIAEQMKAQSQKKELADIGLNQNVQRNIIRDQIRKKIGPLWDHIDAVKQAQINSEIDKAWDGQKNSLPDMIDNALHDARQLAEEMGEPYKDTAVSEALLRAKNAGKVSIKPSDIEHLKQNPGVASEFDKLYGDGAAQAILHEK